MLIIIFIKVTDLRFNYCKIKIFILFINCLLRAYSFLESIIIIITILRNQKKTNKMMNKHFIVCVCVLAFVAARSHRALDNTQQSTNQNETTDSSQESTSACVREGTAKNPKSYSDCKEYSDPSAETICCLVSGTSGGTEGTSCLDVDILFENKTIEYNNNGVSGKLICSTKSNGRFIRIEMMMLLVIICIVI